MMMFFARSSPFEVSKLAFCLDLSLTNEDLELLGWINRDVNERRHGSLEIRPRGLSFETR